MPETRKAKLFRNRAGEAVRLPAEFRFEGSEVYATRDEQSGDVTLSTRPGALMRTIEMPADSMSVRPMNVPPEERELFSDAG